MGHTAVLSRPHMAPFLSPDTGGIPKSGGSKLNGTFNLPAMPSFVSPTTPLISGSLKVFINDYCASQTIPEHHRLPLPKACLLNSMHGPPFPSYEELAIRRISSGVQLNSTTNPLPFWTTWGCTDPFKLIWPHEDMGFVHS